MEAATDTSKFVTPGRDQYHPGVAKCHAYITVSGGTPSLVTSYNITSIADTGVGLCTVTIATDFADANWTFLGGALANDTSSTVRFTAESTTSAKAAGSVRLVGWQAAVGTADPPSYSFAGYGIQ